MPTPKTAAERAKAYRARKRQAEAAMKAEHSIVPTKKSAYSPQTQAITQIEYGEWQEAFDYLNATLFERKLEDVFLTYQRRAHSGGYFSPNRFSSREAEFSGKRHEIALNPDGFNGRTDEFIVSILLHEMVHEWQFMFGKFSGSYHNQEWAAKMEALGLMPSNSGMVGGKRTGQHMAHYVIPGGAYAQAYAALAATGWKLSLQSAIHAGKNKKQDENKKTFTCPSCGQNAWGKPGLDIKCNPCGCIMPARNSNAAASYDQNAASV